MKKVLLFGATGMAGHVVYYYLQSTGKYDISNVVYRTPLTEDSIIVDVTNRDAVADVVHRVHPEIIINCVGILIKGSREHPDNAILINAYFPHLLKRLSDEVGAKLIHISTDCVFSGKKGNYTEDDFRDADDVYGRSKALGEIINDKDLTIRTSIIGPELKINGEGLFHWFMHQHGEVNGFRTAIWGGVTTLELAKAIDFSLDNGIVGLIHLSNGLGISKFDLLNLFKEIWGKDTVIKPYDGNGVDKSIEKSLRLDYEVPSYRQMLVEQFEMMKSYSNLYSAY
ncbi:dTDP-4-dehydrorhamnose reductase family protein [Bacteroides cellulosilyticus]|uniref:dTDP-4-dehydrorhamnose reductase family protein n=1 Tax=Bacteroides cellulosilyticus TaxID=246787 RepID=UPI001C376137|nr:SDR family oxidoreductase [Bacteroides cellulosilyticus]MBV3639564.1 SDR family oxidoreductase [Bacteroides cellulosilyticus]MBV3665594.1 SDR family oxidoreductase [Bacteroides cellulosilyticus]MBV3687712.1 SDR family oxidoreductase [Bacteroides cellulosilyticus]MBV3696363.1 SDR family oxidoreductase [Bacteroides cellulosilyticus]MBV3709978.1 SDR family oxidoreductase [Bacteroides cellulosilyticus]